MRATLLGASVATLLASSVGIATSGAAVANKKLKPDYAFFAGKTITYIVPQSAGGSYSQSIVPAAPFLGQFLHATVNLVYVPQGSSIVGDQQIYAAAPDGLTIGHEGIGALLASVLALGNTGVNFSLQKLTYLAGIPTNPLAIVSCKNSSFTSIDQAVNSKTPFKVINTGSGSGYQFLKVFFNLYKSPAQSLSGYPSTAATTAGCLSGDAPLALQTIASLTPAEFASGTVHALLLGTKPDPRSAYYQYLKLAPTEDQYWKKHPSKLPAAKAVESVESAQYGGTAISQWPAGPPGIPAARALALRNAFKFALSQPTVIANEVNNSTGIGWKPYNLAIPYIKHAVAHKELMNRFINTTYA